MKSARDRQGWTALVTGASGGLGEEFARLLAADRCDLALVARSEEKLTALAHDLSQQFGIRTTVIPADLSRPDSPAMIMQQLAEANCTIDILVNNAGFGLFGLFAESSLEREREMIQVNVTSLVELTRRCLPGMIARRRGRILNVASTAGFQPGPLQALYYGTKACVLIFSEALAYELRGAGITVTTFCPGPVRTGFQAAANLEASGLVYGKRLPSARDVARVGHEAMWKGRGVVIPGALNRWMALAVRFLPRRTVTGIVGRMQEERLK